MTFHFARVCLVVVVVAGPASAGAQTMISAPKAAAQRAVAATNAHTNAMQSPTTTPAPAAPTQVASAPAAQGTKSSGAKTTATPAPAVAPSAKPAAAATPTAKPAAVGAPVAVATPGRTPVRTAPIATAPTTTTAALGKPTAAASPVKPVVATAPRGKNGKPGTPVAAGPATDSAARSISVTERGVKGEVSLSREVYSYDPAGRRDPFVSLLRTGDLRPMLSDLRLVVVLYDPTGRNSIAIMRDVATKDQYRVKVGQTVGRMRVAQIQPKEIVFTIEEVGFSRQEPLALGDSSTARTQ
jgi:hypothetical protein